MEEIIFIKEAFIILLYIIELVVGHQKRNVTTTSATSYEYVIPKLRLTISDLKSKFYYSNNDVDLKNI